MDLSRLAARVGATDVFVLRRLGPDRLVNVDGHGRGAGWAGNVVVDPNADPWLAQAGSDPVLRLRCGVPSRIFGPYWATDAVAVSMEEHVVVFGGPGVPDLPDEMLTEAAASAAASAAELPVAKRLADHLEVSQAALAVATMRPRSVEEAARAVATLAAQSLGCEFGAVLLAGPRWRLFQAEEGWTPPAGEEELIAALLPLTGPARDRELVEQELSRSPFAYRPLSFEDGLVSRCAVPLGLQGSQGLLVVAHASSAPRGFTSLCQRVIRTIAQTAAPVLQDALSVESSPRS